MRRKMSLLSAPGLAALAFLAAACPLHDDTPSETDIQTGEIIGNFPEWIDSDYVNLGVAVCEWKDWQSEDGKKLHAYMPEELPYNDYDGKYRLLVSGQNLILFFDDEPRTAVNLIYVYIGEPSNYGDPSVSVEQKDEGKFVFSGWAKSRDRLDCTDGNRADVCFSRNLEDEDDFCYRGNYRLTVNGATVADETYKVTRKAALDRAAFDTPDFFPKKAYVAFKDTAGDDSDYNVCYRLFCSEDGSRGFGFFCPANFRGIGPDVAACQTNAFLYFYGDMTELSRSDDSAEYYLSGGTDRMAVRLKIAHSGGRYVFSWYGDSSEPLLTEKLYSW